jgi:hypothetical protein
MSLWFKKYFSCVAHNPAGKGKKNKCQRKMNSWEFCRGIFALIIKLHNLFFLF